MNEMATALLPIKGEVLRLLGDGQARSFDAVLTAVNGVSHLSVTAKNLTTVLKELLRQRRVFKTEDDRYTSPVWGEAVASTAQLVRAWAVMYAATVGLSDSLVRLDARALSRTPMPRPKLLAALRSQAGLAAVADAFGVESASYDAAEYSPSGRGAFGQLGGGGQAAKRGTPWLRLSGKPTKSYTRAEADALWQEVLGESAPPGWKGTVKAMKRDQAKGKMPKGLNPFALAWSMHKKGAKPHYSGRAPFKKKQESLADLVVSSGEAVSSTHNVVPYESSMKPTTVSSEIRTRLIALFTTYPGVSYSVDDAAKAVGFTPVEVRAALSTLVNSGILRFERGEGYSLNTDDKGDHVRIPSNLKRTLSTSDFRANLRPTTLRAVTPFRRTEALALFQPGAVLTVEAVCEQLGCTRAEALDALGSLATIGAVRFTEGCGYACDDLDGAIARLAEADKPTCAKCGEYWPCSDSKRRDISPLLRAQHSAKQEDTFGALAKGARFRLPDDVAKAVLVKLGPTSYKVVSAEDEFARGLTVRNVKASEPVLPESEESVDEERTYKGFREATDYIKRISNEGKRAYAQAYLDYLMGKETQVPEASAFKISYMAAQAVRQKLQSFGFDESVGEADEGGLGVYSDYKLARAAAERTAKKLGLSVGIEKRKEFGKTVFTVKLVPKDPSKRFGHELNMEIIESFRASELPPELQKHARYFPQGVGQVRNTKTVDGPKRGYYLRWEEFGTVYRSSGSTHGSRGSYTGTFSIKDILTRIANIEKRGATEYAYPAEPATEEVVEGYQHVNWKGSESLRFQIATGKGKKTVQGRTFGKYIGIHMDSKRSSLPGGGGGTWTLTHIPTGLRLGGAYDDRVVTRVAQAIEKQLGDKLNFTDPATLDPETQAALKAGLARLRESVEEAVEVWTTVAGWTVAHEGDAVLLTDPEGVEWEVDQMEASEDGEDVQLLAYADEDETLTQQDVPREVRTALRDMAEELIGAATAEESVDEALVNGWTISSGARTLKDPKGTTWDVDVLELDRNNRRIAELIAYDVDDETRTLTARQIPKGVQAAIVREVIAQLERDAPDESVAEGEIQRGDRVMVRQHSSTLRGKVVRVKRDPSDSAYDRLTIQWDSGEQTQKDAADVELEEVEEETRKEWAARQPKAQVLPGSEAAHARFQEARKAKKGKGVWRTTKSGHKIYIENGRITKGNPHVIGRKTDEGFGRAARKVGQRVAHVFGGGPRWRRRVRNLSKRIPEGDLSEVTRQEEFEKLSAMSLTALQGLLRRVGYDGPKITNREQAVEEIMALRYGEDWQVPESVDESLFEPGQSEGEFVMLLKSELKAPWVEVSLSSIGGTANARVMVRLSLDPKEAWTNGILQNSRYAMFSIARDGAIELFSGVREPKFRKTKAKTQADALAKLNAWIAKATTAESAFDVDAFLADQPDPASALLALAEAEPDTLYAVYSPDGLDKPEMTLIGLFADRSRAHALARNDNQVRSRWPLVKTEVRKLKGASVAKHLRLLSMSRGAVTSDIREATLSGSSGGFFHGRQAPNGFSRGGPGGGGPLCSPFTLEGEGKKPKPQGRTGSIESVRSDEGLEEALGTEHKGKDIERLKDEMLRQKVAVLTLTRVAQASKWGYFFYNTVGGSSGSSTEASNADKFAQAHVARSSKSWIGSDRVFVIVGQKRPAEDKVARAYFVDAETGEPSAAPVGEALTPKDLKVGSYYGVKTSNASTEDDVILFVTGVQANGTAKGVAYDVRRRKAKKASFNGYNLSTAHEIAPLDLDGGDRALIRKVAESEDVEEAAVNHRTFARHGLVHPSFVRSWWKVGAEIDFYAPPTGDKMSGVIRKISSDSVTVQAHTDDGLVGGGATFTLRIGSALPGVGEAEEAIRVTRKQYDASLPWSEDDKKAMKKIRRKDHIGGFTYYPTTPEQTARVQSVFALDESVDVLSEGVTSEAKKEPVLLRLRTAAPSDRVERMVRHHGGKLGAASNHVLPVHFDKDDDREAFLSSVKRQNQEEAVLDERDYRVTIKKPDGTYYSEFKATTSAQARAGVKAAMAKHEHGPKTTMKVEVWLDTKDDETGKPRGWTEVNSLWQPMSEAFTTTIHADGGRWHIDGDEDEVEVRGDGEVYKVTLDARDRLVVVDSDGEEVSPRELPQRVLVAARDILSDVGESQRDWPDLPDEDDDLECVALPEVEESLAVLGGLALAAITGIPLGSAVVKAVRTTKELLDLGKKSAAEKTWSAISKQDRAKVVAWAKKKRTAESVLRVPSARVESFFARAAEFNVPDSAPATIADDGDLLVTLPADVAEAVSDALDLASDTVLLATH